MIEGKKESVEVHLWGSLVGGLVDDGHKIIFEYDTEYLRNGHSISPLHLPLNVEVFSTSTPFKNDVFAGLYGVFADSLPDLYGKKVIKEYMKQKHGGNHTLTTLGSLMYIGSRGLGALEYKPAENIDVDLSEILQLHDLVEQSKKIVQGDVLDTSDVNHVINSIMYSGSLAGGARPKAVIGWNRLDNTIIVGAPPLPANYENWIIKFDGSKGMSEDWGKIEYSYSKIAKKYGLNMTDTMLISQGTNNHFMTKRFDIQNNERLHVHSLSGVWQDDFNQSRVNDYFDFFMQTRELTRDHREVSKAFKQLIFNYVGCNKDDHTKNFSFIMNKKGKWQLSPAYDLIFCHSDNQLAWTNKHQMRVCCK